MSIATVEVKPAKFGKGCFAKQDFKKNETVGKVAGREYDFDRCPEVSYTYVIDLYRDNMVLNPFSPFRYINHDCYPNCQFQYEDGKIYVVTMKPILKGEELTVDYSWPADVAIPCGCGHKRCRGFIVAKEELHLVKANG